MELDVLLCDIFEERFHSIKGHSMGGTAGPNAVVGGVIGKRVVVEGGQGGAPTTRGQERPNIGTEKIRTSQAGLARLGRTPMEKKSITPMKSKIGSVRERPD